MLVDPRPDGDTLLTAYVATQHPHMARDLLVQYTGLEPDQLRVVAPHVGGAFGGKAGIGFDHGAIVGRGPTPRPPGGVDRDAQRGDALDARPRPGAVRRARADQRRPHRRAAGPQHRRLRRVRRLRRHPSSSGRRAIMAQGPYEIPKIDYSAIAAMTNTAPNGAFRGAGRPEAAAMLERLLDLAAVELDLTPEEIRRRNLIAEGRLPLHDPHRADLRRGRLRAGARGGAADRRRRRAAGRAGAPARGRRGEAARHRRLDLRRDHRLRRHRARQRADRARRLGDRDVRHLGARPGPRDVVRDDRGRPAGHPDRARSATSSPTPVRSRPAAAPAAPGRCSSAAARSRPPRRRCATRRASSPPPCSRRRPRTSS